MEFLARGCFGVIRLLFPPLLPIPPLLLFNKVRVLLDLFGELQMIVDYLEEDLRRGKASRLQFRPHGHIVEGDLEGARRDELALEHVAQEEDHHAGVDLVRLQVAPPTGRLHSEEAERTDRTDHRHNDDDLDGEYYLREVIVETRRIIVAAVDLDLRILVAQQTHIVLEGLAIAAGVAVPHRKIS